MDIKITDSSLRRFLDTKASATEIAEKVSLCGPTFDRIHVRGSDHLFEIEAITNRIDTASAQGVAREAAIILNQFDVSAKMVNDPYKESVDLYEKHPQKIHFDVASKDLVQRFMAVTLENISVKDSPQETQELLTNCDQRPINNVVDITNELTLLCGLPSHIFDYDKLAVQKLTIRESHSGETVTTLDNQKNILKGGDIVIEDGSERLVDLCGIMGGAVAEVDEHTKNILLIVSVYHPKKIRTTSLYLQKRTLAAQIYEKQPDPELCLPVITKAIQLFKERAGAEVSSSIFDFYPVKCPPKIVSIDLDWLNRFSGVSLDSQKVIIILEGLGFKVTPKENSTLSCEVPSWRYLDINIKEDLAEEIVRVYGYFRLPATLPCVNLPAEPRNTLLETELKTKKYLAHTGFNEIFNNSLIPQSLIEKVALDPKNHLKLVNALSSDFEYLRTNLVPSVIQNLKKNQGKTDQTLRLFELANCYLKNETSDLPNEVSTLTTVSTLDYRQAKGEMENLLRHLNLNKITFVPAQKTPAYLSERQTADIFSGKTQIGQIGLIKPTVLRNLGLETNPVATEINVTKLVSELATGFNYDPISEYPQNIETLTITSSKLIGEMIESIKNTDPLIRQVSYVESYNDKHTFQISFGALDRNLDQKEVNLLKEKVITACQ